MKITFEDQVKKFTDFFEDCILKITFEDQVQKSTAGNGTQRKTVIFTADIFAV